MIGLTRYCPWALKASEGLFVGNEERRFATASKHKATNYD
jgi:hypothetical protein